MSKYTPPMQGQGLDITEVFMQGFYNHIWARRACGWLHLIKLTTIIIIVVVVVVIIIVVVIVIINIIILMLYMVYEWQYNNTIQYIYLLHYYNIFICCTITI